MDWLTRASCSGFQAGVFFKRVRTLQLCSATTSKEQPKLFEQRFPSIYRGSDGRRVTDLHEVIIRMYRTSMPASIQVMKEVQILPLCQCGVSD